ncbi:MAG: thiamine phosphate synthase [Campylobacterales bacterium]|nr:thiamine phosphate synthase [Campylobacterales bacterium]
MHSYLITSQSFYSDTPRIFAQRLEEQIIKHKPDFMLLRDKETQNYEALAEEFLTISKRYPTIKAFLHREIELAFRLGAYGVHLSSDMLKEIEKAKALGLEVVVSTHTIEEVLFAQDAGADYVTYSPIFASPGKGEPKGINALRELLKRVSIKVFALGGIVTQEQIESIKSTGTYGFASIRYFY